MKDEDTPVALMHQELMAGLTTFTKCCGKPMVRTEDGRAVVLWNPYNRVVQCHCCGAIYEPQEEENESDD